MGSRRGGSGLTQKQRFTLLSLAKGKGQYDASNFRVAGSNADRFIDALDANKYVEQLTVGNQVVIPTADANFANAKTATFAGGQRYVSNQAAAYWAFLNDGTGGVAFTGFRTATAGFVMSLFSTRASAAGTEVGINMFVNTSTGMGVNVANGTAEIFTGTSAGAPQNLSLYMRYSGNTADSPDASYYRKSVLGSTADWSGTPGTTPNSTLVLGSTSASTLSYAGTWAFSWFYTALTSAEINIVQTQIQNIYGMTP